MQDFAPFIPELRGAFSGPQTPGHKGHRASSAQQTAQPSASICLLLQNLMTSLITIAEITLDRAIVVLKFDMAH